MKSDIVIISTSGWNDIWTRKQRLTMYLLTKGHKILFIEPPEGLNLSRGITLLGFKRLIKFIQGKRFLKDNLYIITPPPLIPGALNNKFINRIYQIIFYRFLKRLTKSLHFVNPFIINYLPYIPNVISAMRFSAKLLVYDCVDNFACMQGFLINPKIIENLETEIIKFSDICIVTNKILLQKHQSLTKNIFLIPNGVDFDFFNQVSTRKFNEPSDLQHIPHPRIGFVGTIQYWLDYNLIERLSKSCPKFSFVFIGPIFDKQQVSSLKYYSNIYFLGAKDYAILPHYLQYLDVLILPFKSKGIAESASPLKLYEYLATGKPIVSTSISEVEDIKNIIFVAKNDNDFIHCLYQAVLQTNGYYKLKRLDYAHKCDWDNRFSDFYEIIMHHLSKNEKKKNSKN